VFSTSGTTGLRAIVVYSEEEFALWIAVHLRLFHRIEITPQTRLAAIGAPSPLHFTNQLFAAFRSGGVGTPRLSVVTPLAETVAALNEYRPDALLGYPSIIALLAQEQLDGRLRIAPRIVGLGGEVLTDASALSPPNSSISVAFARVGSSSSATSPLAASGPSVSR